MQATAVHTALPMTQRIHRQLEARSRDLEHQVARVGVEEMTALREIAAVHREPSRLDVLRSEQRTLMQALRTAEVVEPDGRAVIGTVVHLRSPRAEVVVVELTFPGDPDPDKATPASPIGVALLGRQVGESIEIVAPSGRTRWTVTAVDPR